MLLCGGRKAAAREELFGFWTAENGPAVPALMRSRPILTAMSHLEPILEPAIEAAGYRLVRLRLMGGKTKTLQIMAERPDGTMNVEDCARLSHALLDFIAREEPLEGDYELEVSSPGIDRPLTRLMDFSRWAGHEAKVELLAPIDGRKRFRGKLLGLEGNDVAMETQGTRLTFPFKGIAEAKLVLTDELIAEDLRSRERTRS